MKNKIFLNEMKWGENRMIVLFHENYLLPVYI